MEIVDGSAKFKVRDERLQALIDLVYPVGIVVAIADKNNPEFMEYGTWEEVASGRVLQGGDNPGTTIEAGLPNIKGHIEDATNWYIPNSKSNFTGAFYSDNVRRLGIAGGNDHAGAYLEFDASRSSAIYGKSTTVQPPAYVVKFYRRTA